MAALFRSIPCCSRTDIPSATTMELSTIIPREMTSAPRDMRCRSIPKIAMNIKVARIVRTSPVPMTTPMRQPMASVSTARTMATASMRLMKKPFIDSATTSDIQWTR